MANDIVIDVKANNKVGAGFAAARREAKDFGDDLVKIGKKAGTEVAAMGPKLGASLADGLTKSFGPTGGALVGALGVGVAAVAPMLGATISAAVVGGAAAGGVIGGLALVAKDPQVKAMSISLGEEVMGGLEERAELFVAPALRGIAKVRKGWQEIGPDLDKIFRSSAAYVDPLVDGLVAGGKKAVGGIATAIGRAGPIVDAFGESFSKLGGMVGDLFEKLSEDPQAAADGFSEFTDVIVETVDQVGNLLMALTKTYGALGKTDDVIDDWRHSLEDALSIDGGPEFDITADGMSNMERKAKEAADANRELAGSSEDATNATKEHTSSLKELADELRAETEPAFALLKAETDLGEARRKHSKAVKKYGEDSAEARAALQDMAAASIDLQGAVGELGAEFDGQLSPALRSTLKSAGLTDKEIRALEKSFVRVKGKAEDFEGNYEANVKVNGTGKAMNQLYGVLDVIRDIPRAVNVAIRITGDTNVSRQANNIRKNYASGGIVGGAASGRTMGDEWSWVGEQGPEAVKLPAGATVRSAGDSMRMMRQGMDGGGQRGGTMTLKPDVDPTLNNTLLGVLLSALRLEIGNQGGNVQQVLGRN